MKKLFGTDGVRGIANSELTCEIAMNIGRAAGIVLSKYFHHKSTFIIGKDTRASSDMIESALAAGICSVGSNVIFLGVVPTPAVALLVKKYNADAGFMISASHNPMEYNGIKIFNKDGYKLSDDLEEKIEDIIASQKFDLDIGKNLGKTKHEKNSVDDYVDYVKSTLDNIDVSGLKVAIDCANGSSSVTAQKLFQSLGVDCLIINNEPNGININKCCGSTYMETVSKFTVENKCDIGFSFDGDADRCLVVDENGEVLDGDKIIAIMSKHLKNEGRLKKNTFVVTVMSNLGLIKMADECGMKVEKTNVGDRYVLEKIIDGGYCIGGESSGHIILSDYSTTGDGQLVAVHFLKIVKQLQLAVSKLSKVMNVYPQVLINVKVSNENKYKILDNSEISEKIYKYETALGNDGRILLRPSGTEPLVRIMVEGKNEDQVNFIAKDLSMIVEERLGI